MRVKTAAASRSSALIGVAIAFGWPVIVSSIPGLTQHQITSVHDDLVTICAEWLIAAILFVIAFAIQRQPISEFGIRGLGWRDILACFCGAIIAFALSIAVSRLVSMPSSGFDMHRLASVPVAVRIALVLTAAICEEFIYRGFGIEELALLTGNRGFAAVFTLVLFTLSHLGVYGFSSTLIIPGLIGAVLTALYVIRRNLVSCMLMHSFMDGVSLILVPMVLQNLKGA